MDFFANLSLGFSAALHPINILFCFFGVLAGTVVGVLPGIGPIATIAMLLPLTFTLDPTTSLIMLAGIYYGSQYGSSTTAILLNLPGEASSAITTIDGYQMARKGRAGPALAAAALSSFFAGTVATIVILLVAKPLTVVALNFGPAEYFSLMVLGLMSSIALASGSVLNALAMVCLGLLLGLTGTDIYTGQSRFTYNLPNLLDGLNFGAIAVGVFGISEIIRNLESGNSVQGVVAKVTRIWPSREDLRRIIGPSVRGTAIGSILGILPGAGALLASFIAYHVEKKVSKNGAEFGKGAIEAVAAPEAANNAGAQTAFIPLLSLGIPSTATMAIMLGALTIHGITPGPNVAATHPALFWGVIVSMWIGNLMLVVLNLPLIGIWVKLLSIPYKVLFPAVIAFACIGVYSLDNGPFNIWILAVFGIVGYILVKLECELAPFVLGFILGPMIEEHLRRAMIISDGDPSIFLTRPVSALLLAVAAIVLLLICIPSIAKKREAVFVEE